MQDIIKRLVIVAIMAACIGIIFIGGRSANAESNNDELNKNTWSWPVTGVITDTFGTRHGRHKGLDIAAPLGEEIYAVHDGIVKKSYYSSSSYGNVIFIEHPNGYETVYAHLSKRNVKEGDKVHKGQMIGKIGSTGRSTGPHLHFEIHNGEWNSSRNNAINPLTLLTENQKLVMNVEDDSVETAKLQKKDIYIVKSGDTLSEIAEEVGISVRDIMEINNLNSDLIFPNQILMIEKS